MENVLAAFIMIFLFLFSALTISTSLLSAQGMTRSAWQSMQTRAETKARTHLSPVGALGVKQLSDAPLATFDFAFKNDGQVKLLDFADWDVFVEYTDTSTPPNPHIVRLPMVAADAVDGPDAITSSHWSVENIYSVYLDTPVQHHVLESIEPHVVNPGEVLVVRLTLTPPAQPGTTLQVTVSTPTGVSTSTQFTPDDPPILVANTLLTAVHGKPMLISRTQLSTTDDDDAPENVVYTVTMPPQQGTLNLGNTFTQLAIDNDRLQYTHTGDGSDNFVFTVTDGKTVIGPFTFQIGVIYAPELVANLGITAADGETVVIDATRLNTTDFDTQPTDLVYKVTEPPAHGTLSPGDTFTQADINNGVLTYTSTSADGDQFTFTVTDGQTTIGPYTFSITKPS